MIMLPRSPAKTALLLAVAALAACGAEDKPSDNQVNL